MNRISKYICNKLMDVFPDNVCINICETTIIQEYIMKYNVNFDIERNYLKVNKYLS